jgi:flagellar basal body-associated protein FliL
VSRRSDQWQTYFIIIIIVIIIIIIIIIITTTTTTTTTYILNAIQFSPGDNSPYTSTDKTNKNKMYINETIQNTAQTVQNTVNTSTHIAKTPHALHKGVSEFAALFCRFG